MNCLLGKCLALANFRCGCANVATTDAQWTDATTSARLIAPPFATTTMAASLIQRKAHTMLPSGDQCVRPKTLGRSPVMRKLPKQWTEQA
jgi:hypothetical protein